MEELRKTKKNWKMATIEGKAALKQLRDTLRDELKNTRKAEQKSALRKKKSKQQTAFIANPYSYTSQMLGQYRSGTLNCSQAELEDHLFQIHHDPCRGEEFPPFEGPTSVYELKCSFSLGQIQFKEFQEVVKRGRANSSPGPSGLTYALMQYIKGAQSCYAGCGNCLKQYGFTKKYQRNGIGLKVYMFQKRRNLLL